MIGRGSPALIERARRYQSHELDEAAQAAMLERFFHHYEYLEESGEFKAGRLQGRPRLARAAQGGRADRRGHQQA